MNEVTVESIFGTNAGIVWKALNKNGPSNIDSIAKARKETKVMAEILRY